MKDQTIAAMVESSNYAKGIPPSEEEVPIFKRKYQLTEEQVSRYHYIRYRLRELYPTVISSFDRNVINWGGQQLGIQDGDSLLLNTEHEINVFLDYCLYQHRRDGLNGIQRSYNQYSMNYSGDMLDVFKAAKDGYFAYLDILGAIGDGGLVVYDGWRKEEHLMIDIGLSKVATSPHCYAILTHVMDFNEFIITTGASTPVAVHTEAGSKVQRRFEQHLKSKPSEGNLAIEARTQYVTDMYKICLHEDITGTVASPSVPFGSQALKERVWLSDKMN